MFGKRLRTTLSSGGGLDQVATQCAHHNYLILVICHSTPNPFSKLD